MSCIGKDALEISEEHRKKLEVVITKFQDFCLGETNETYVRFVFNSRQKKENETVDQYITALRRLAQTCNFCACLRDSLIRDCLVLGINNNNVQKKLLQDRKLTLAKAINICRSSEKKKQQVKKISADNATNEAEINAFVNNKTGAGSREGGRVGVDRRDGGSNKIRCRYCSTTHQRTHHLEVVAMSAAEKNILRMSAWKKRKSLGRDQYRLYQEVNPPIQVIQHKL